jgi:hypothetical protein
MSRIRSSVRKQTIFFIASRLIVILFVASLPLDSSDGDGRSVPEKELLSIDFQTKDFSQWKNTCGACKFSLRDKQFVRPDPAGMRGYVGVYEGGSRRNESASDSLPRDRDITIKWSLYFDEDFNEMSSGTISQLIGRKPCFKGGLFHLRYESGNWGYWLRNVPGEHDVSTKIPVRKGEWVDVQVDAKFTSNSDGYIFLFIKQGEEERAFVVAKNEPTYNSCKAGAYFKVGLYGSFTAEDQLLVDDIHANLADGARKRNLPAN